MKEELLRGAGRRLDEVSIKERPSRIERSERAACRELPSKQAAAQLCGFNLYPDPTPVFASPRSSDTDQRSKTQAVGLFFFGRRV